MNASRTLLVVMMLATVFTGQAQIDLGKKLEQKAKQRLDRKVDRTIDKGFDKAEDGVDKGAKEATKKKDAEDDGQPEAPDTAPDKSSNDAATGNEAAAPAGASPAVLKAYSKFDFVAGEKVVAFEDFTQDAIGDFPAKWNTNASGEVVTITDRPERWFMLSGDGVFHPEFIGTIPENATIEFDMAVLGDYATYCKFVSVSFISGQDNPLRASNKGKVSVHTHPGIGPATGKTYIQVYDKDGMQIAGNDRTQTQLVHKGVAPFAHVSIWRQKNRMRMYLNEEKIWDLPRAFQNEVDYQLLLQGGACKESIPYITNLRVAVGSPDTRNKLITEGRLVTRGILFDSGSDRIKGESYGTLKEIAAVLSENAAVRVNIIGHTDSDGDDAANMELSKRRAASVKEALSREFGIDAGRMETDGKGEGQPAGPNDTPQGKANNRRVEFVKL